MYNRNNGCSDSTHSTAQSLLCAGTSSSHQRSRPDVKGHSARGMAAALSYTRQVGTEWPCAALPAMAASAICKQVRGKKRWFGVIMIPCLLRALKLRRAESFQGLASVVTSKAVWRLVTHQQTHLESDSILAHTEPKCNASTMTHSAGQPEAIHASPQPIPVCCIQVSVCMAPAQCKQALRGCKGCGSSTAALVPSEHVNMS